MFKIKSYDGVKSFQYLLNEPYKTIRMYQQHILSATTCSMKFHTIKFMAALAGLVPPHTTQPFFCSSVVQDLKTLFLIIFRKFSKMYLCYTKKNTHYAAYISITTKQYFFLIVIFLTYNCTLSLFVTFVNVLGFLDFFKS